MNSTARSNLSRASPGTTAQTRARIGVDGGGTSSQTGSMPAPLPRTCASRASPRADRGPPPSRYRRRPRTHRAPRSRSAPTASPGRSDRPLPDSRLHPRRPDIPATLGRYVYAKCQPRRVPTPAELARRAYGALSSGLSVTSLSKDRGRRHYARRSSYERNGRGLTGGIPAISPLLAMSVSAAHNS